MTSAFCTAAPSGPAVNNGRPAHHVFEDKCKRLAGVDDVMQENNVGVFQAFEQRNYKHTGMNADADVDLAR